jgi:hypothetical protein
VAFSDWVSGISLAIALAAFGINGASFRDRRRQDRRDLFLKMHERLVEPELQEGRRVIFETIHSRADAAALRAAGGKEYALANRALAMYDVFALYVSEGYIEHDLALREWGPNLASIWGHARFFIEDREAAASRSVWLNLQNFANEAIERREVQAASDSS